VARIRIAPDARIKAIVQSWPARFDTARARALGFEADAGFDEVVAAYVAGQTTEGPRP
jgi:nucleoside-diphosphate-sugar epimerase